MTDTDTDTDVDVHRRITETAERIKLTTKIKRGEGTRDQDTIKVKISGDDPEDTVERLNDTLAAMTDIPDELRAIDPERDE